MQRPSPPAGLGQARLKNGEVGILLASANAASVATLTTRLALGRRGEMMRRLDLPPASEDVQSSAQTAVAHASNILRRERYLDRDFVASFTTDADLVNVRGRSADLAFALAFVVGLLPDVKWPPITATGRLMPEGGIAAVEAVGAKLAASLAMLPEGGVVLYPGGNEDDLTTALRAQARASGVQLVGVHRLEEALDALGLGLSKTWLASPFRGLEPFGFEHAAIFFGRGREIGELVELWRWRSQGLPAILIEGPSGAGKSSLMLAGLLPALCRRGATGRSDVPLFWALLRPGDIVPAADPAEERRRLQAALAAAWGRRDEGGLNAADAPPLEAPAMLAWLSRQTRAGGGGTFLLACDQLEGWFTTAFHPDTRKQFFSLLAGLIERGVGVIATITPNAIPALGHYPELSVCFGVEGRYALGPPREAVSLQAIIQGPAQAAGLRYENGLEAEIFAAAGHGGPDILPLLELLLTDLHERRDPATNLLRFEDYLSVGGLEGVVSRRAEDIFATLANSEQALVAELLWKLLTAGVILPADFPPPSKMPDLLEAFQTRRLLVTTGNEATTRLRPAHAALLRHWQRAVDIYKAEETDIQLWQELTREAAQWRRGARALIPAGPQLQAAVSLLARRAQRWTASEQPVRDYVQASHTRHGRRRVLTAAMLGVPAIIAAGFAARSATAYVAGLYITRIRFTDVPLSAATNYTAAAAPFLHEHGLLVRHPVPDRTIAVIRGNLGLYGGRAVAPDGGGNVFTAQADPAAAPIGFTLSIVQAVPEIRLLRAALWADTESGVTHPAWQAQALDESGNVIATAGEQLLASYSDIPAKWLQLRLATGQKIVAIRLISDFRRNGVPFAGFQAALIEEIQLIH